MSQIHPSLHSLSLRDSPPTATTLSYHTQLMWMAGGISPSSQRPWICIILSHKVQSRKHSLHEHPMDKPSFQRTDPLLPSWISRNALPDSRILQGMCSAWLGRTRSSQWDSAPSAPSRWLYKTLQILPPGKNSWHHYPASHKQRNKNILKQSFYLCLNSHWWLFPSLLRCHGCQPTFWHLQHLGAQRTTVQLCFL